MAEKEDPKKAPAKAPVETSPEQYEEYELLPHKEIEELREELHKLKEFEITPTKKLKVGLVELNTKLDKMLNIFDEAREEIKLEEGGLSFHEKMKPMVEKMNKILEQNSEIAEGIVAIADLVKDLKEGLEEKGITTRTAIEPETHMATHPGAIPMPPRAGPPGARPTPRPMPGRPLPAPTAGIPGPRPAPAVGIPPPPKRKRTFGII